MLCNVCASIDLSDFFTPPGEHDDQYKPRLILHYESYNDMVAAAESCQLCTLVVEGLEAIEDKPPWTIHPIYRSLGHESDSNLAKSQDIVGRPIRPSDDPEVLLRWYHECTQAHEECNLNLTGPDHHFMPTRVIDVGSTSFPVVRLRNGNQCSGPYATLSYCWGSTVQNRTTTNTLSNFMDRIDFLTLCKTMRNAIIVTRNLGIPFLWIDALCIIQDDAEDWEREALLMSEVYTQSTITIAASSASDGNEGCFFRRFDRLTAHLLWTAYEGMPPEKLRFRKHDAFRFTTLVEHGSLNQRAWAMQERSLSRRIIHFTNDRLFWECQQHTLEESFSIVDKLWTPKIKGFQFASQFAKAEISGDSRALEINWHQVVEAYSRRQLTYQSDRLPALAGLAQTLAKLSMDRYVAGCWRYNLPLSLLWAKDLGVESKPSIPGYPSWSWASFDGAVRYNPVTWTPQLDMMLNLVEDVEASIDGSVTSVVYGNIRKGSLKLKGRIKQAVFRGDRTDNEYDQRTPWMITLDDQYYVHRLASFDREPVFNSLIPILQLCQYDRTHDERTEFVMLLQPTGQAENHFRRLGLGVIVWYRPNTDEEDHRRRDRIHESWFKDAPKVDLSIE